MKNHIMNFVLFTQGRGTATSLTYLNLFPLNDGKNICDEEGLIDH